MCKREGEWGAGWKDSLIPRPLPGEKNLGTRLGGGRERERDKWTDRQEIVRHTRRLLMDNMSLRI